MTNATLGQGTTLKKGEYAIAKLYQIGDFGGSRDDLDITTHDTSGNADEFMAGMIHGGEFTVLGYLDAGDTSGQIAAIGTDFGAGTKSTYTITLPNSEASTWAFTGHVKTYRVTPELKGAIRISITFKISGAPVWTT